MENDSSRLPHADSTQHLLRSLWGDRRIGAAIATAAALLLGFAIVHFIPRGPA